MKILADSQKGKQAHFQYKSLEDEFKREAKILKTLNHPHIIKLVKSHLLDEEVETIERNSSDDSRNSNKSSEEGESNQNKSDFSKYILLDWAENGDLFDFVVSINEAMGEDLGRFYFS